MLVLALYSIATLKILKAYFRPFTLNHWKNQPLKAKAEIKPSEAERKKGRRVFLYDDVFPFPATHKEQKMELAKPSNTISNIWNFSTRGIFLSG